MPSKCSRKQTKKALLKWSTHARAQSKTVRTMRRRKRRKSMKGSLLRVKLGLMMSIACSMEQGSMDRTTTILATKKRISSIWRRSRKMASSMILMVAKSQIYQKSILMVFHTMSTCEGMFWIWKLWPGTGTLKVYSTMRLDTARSKS